MNTKLIIISASLIISFLTISSAGAESNLVGYWKMNDNWNDSSSNGNDGTGHDGATFADGIVGRCGSFNGSSSYVDVGTGDSLNVAYSGFTLMAWIKPSVTSPSSNIIEIGTFDKKCALTVYGTSGICVIHRYTGAAHGIRYMSGFGHWDTSKWYHIAATWDGSTYKLYIDGVSYPYRTGTYNIGPANTIGKSGAYTSRGWFFHGLIDEAKVCNRALSEEEIKTEYETVGLVALYHMNEDSWDGTPLEVLDSSGQGNHGTACGGATTVAPGKFGTHCGSFDGINGYVDCGNGSSLSSTRITVSAWLYPKEFPTGTHNKHYIGKWGPAVSQSEYICYFATGQNGKVEFQIRNNAGQYNQYRSTAALSLNTWSHVVMTWDGSDIKIYVNGIEGGTYISNQFDGDIRTSTADLRLGYDSYSAGQGWSDALYNGTIDEVAIYNRALTASEILEHYKRGACNLRFQVRSGSADPPTGDFVGHDGTTGTYFTDASGEDTGINVPDNRYFQYKAYFSTEDKGYTPELSSVTITYGSNGGGGVSGAYIYQWEESF